MTQHPFLAAGRAGKLSDAWLGLWLSQDRVYAAHAYPRCIGQLINKIPFSAQHALDSEEERMNARVLELLTFSLQNVVREVQFFKATARRFSIPIEGWDVRKGTREYTAEMARVGANGSLFEGIVFLWAMEKVYLDSWTFVAEGTKGQDSAVAVLANNWTCPEFRAFVDQLTDLVDDMWMNGTPSMIGDARLVWERVVELEAAFWPDEHESAARAQ
ncbi:heme oxygenase-like protein [Auricularia subglabra TFB-10046 SS5]|nr:heme oxygenase-like protein [Auricularia subglabra TFB-10046 SS5]